MRHEFSDSLASNSFIPLIFQPTRMSSHFNTLIDNIFSSVINPDIILGNLTATISNHLPQFATITNIFGNISSNKSKIYEGTGPNVIEKILFWTIFLLTGRICRKIDELNADNSTKIYLDKINMF